MKKIRIAILLLASWSVSWAQTHPVNVGIGINPLYPLHVSGDGGSSDPLATLYLNSTANHGGIVINSILDKQSHLRFSENGALQWQFRVPNQLSPDIRLYSWGASKDIMTWQYSTGNVGVGTTSPNAKLDVHGEIKLNGGTQNFTISNLTGTEPGYGDFVNYGGIAINGDNGGNRQMFMFSDGSSSHNIFTVASSTDAGSTWSSRLVVQQTGNVGIGKASPARKLDVSGSARIETGTTFDFESDKLDIYGNNSPATLRILSGSNGSNSATMNIGSNSARDWEIVAKAYDVTEGYVLNFNHKTTDYQGPVTYSWNSLEKFRIEPNGNVGIGTTTPESKLSVDGQIRATEVKVLTDVNSVPDYVFEPDYDLRTLQETKEFITENKHLPEIPSAAEMGENGIDLGDMNMRLLKKIEELTLYQIELLERLEKAEGKITKLENK